VKAVEAGGVDRTGGGELHGCANPSGEPFSGQMLREWGLVCFFRDQAVDAVERWLSGENRSASKPKVDCKAVCSRKGAGIATDSNRAEQQPDRQVARIWALVSTSPAKTLWHVHGLPVRVLILRIWNALIGDRIFGHAAELSFYFLFALFPTLLCASAVLGIAARSAHLIYARLLDYLALVIPGAALGAVMRTFDETASAASSGKITIGLIVAVWSASAGMSAIQDTLNAVYKIVDSRRFLWARLCAIGLTFLMTLIISLGLGALLGADYASRVIEQRFLDPALRDAAVIAVRSAEWVVTGFLLVLSFSVVYYWAPDIKARRWRWLTPGGVTGILGWVLASVGLRLYLHYFDTYTLTYGSLGAVIILLMWFYITGLMILLGAEINSEIEAAEAEFALAQLFQSEVE
jgi:membrane protein